MDLSLDNLRPAGSMETVQNGEPSTPSDVPTLPRTSGAAPGPADPGYDALNQVLGAMVQGVLDGVTDHGRVLDAGQVRERAARVVSALAGGGGQARVAPRPGAAGSDDARVGGRRPGRRGHRRQPLDRQPLGPRKEDPQRQGGPESSIHPQRGCRGAEPREGEACRSRCSRAERGWFRSSEAEGGQLEEARAERRQQSEPRPNSSPSWSKSSAARRPPRCSG